MHDTGQMTACLGSIGAVQGDAIDLDAINSLAIHRCAICLAIDWLAIGSCSAIGPIEGLGPAKRREAQNVVRNFLQRP